MNKNAIIVLLLVMPTLCFAGIVKGRITEQGTNEPLTGATIVTQNGQGTTADLDGNYSLDLKNGTYTMTVHFTGYKPIINTSVPSSSTSFPRGNGHTSFSMPLKDLS